MGLVRSPGVETPSAATGLTNLVGTMFPDAWVYKVAGAAGTNSIPPKSGHRRACAGDPPGTLRAMTRFRSRSSNVLPGCNQALRRRVLRSWRIFSGLASAGAQWGLHLLFLPRSPAARCCSR
jgi:hypothetical protein